MYTISEHAYDRVKERCGWKKTALDRMLPKILSEGLAHSSFSGRLKKWIDKVYLEHKNASKLLVWKGYLFIFISDVLVSVYFIPRDLK